MTGNVGITGSNDYIEIELGKRLHKLGEVLGCDVITIIAPMYAPVDNVIKSAIEQIPDKQQSLGVVLETSGGVIEVVERIANTMRHHYDSGEISFIIPNMAMSAGTVLTMCGDRIFMNYYSVLGPIDPQVKSRTSDEFVPALGYLDKYEELVEKSKKGQLTSAEMAFMVQKFDPAALDSFEKAKDLSIVLLEEWLTKYKFKNWLKTNTRGETVTDQMRRARAQEIGQKLNDTKKWKTHSRGISMDVLRKDLNLIIEDFSENVALGDAIQSYYHLLQDYMQKRGSIFAIQNVKGIELVGG